MKSAQSIMPLPSSSTPLAQSSPPKPPPHRHRQRSSDRRRGRSDRRIDQPLPSSSTPLVQSISKPPPGRPPPPPPPPPPQDGSFGAVGIETVESSRRRRRRRSFHSLRPPAPPAQFGCIAQSSSPQSTIWNPPSSSVSLLQISSPVGSSVGHAGWPSSSRRRSRWFVAVVVNRGCRSRTPSSPVHTGSEQSTAPLPSLSRLSVQSSSPSPSDSASASLSAPPPTPTPTRPHPRPPPGSRCSQTSRIRQIRAKVQVASIFRSWWSLL